MPNRIRSSTAIFTCSELFLAHLFSDETNLGIRGTADWWKVGRANMPPGQRGHHPVIGSRRLKPYLV
jgi:hypothetical protein